MKRIRYSDTLTTMVPSIPLSFALLLIILIPQKHTGEAFSPQLQRSRPCPQPHRSSTRLYDNTEWTGQVVPDADNRIRGCQIQNLGTSPTEWLVTIDGVEADLAGFSRAIYQKITRDAKQQRFQGFRPGTIPPHLEPTYRAFCMDECARETTLEALLQNNVQPFEQCRSDMMIVNVSIPPPSPTKGKRKKKKKSRKQQKLEEQQREDSSSNTENTATDAEPSEAQQWRSFATMKEAIDAGWKPGQSFSFQARNVKGQGLSSTTAMAGTDVSTRLFGNDDV